MRNNYPLKIYLLSLLFFIFHSLLWAQQPAIVLLRGNKLSISIGGKNILEGLLNDSQINYRIQNQSQNINGALHQVITITANNFKSFEFNGIITGNTESIACESDPKEGGIKFVRHSVGPSHSLLNNAVYNRPDDWLLSFDRGNPKVHIEPTVDEKFNVQVKGWEIVIRFRPAYYRMHRGLSYFKPREYSVWKKPIVGWCSWFAYFDKIKEEDVKETADIIAEKLKPFGLEYLQIDDGYQQNPIGMPETWLQSNNKFPSGISSLATYIKSKGLIPGIWTNVSFADSAAAYQHKSLFVRDNRNNPAKGNWVGYVMDGSNPESVQKLITPVYKGLKNSGWQYFKLDALRHLKYEGYNSYKYFFDKEKYNRNLAFRNVVKEVRKQIGKEDFLLACWGIRPELVGIVDGCRIGNDGFSYAGLAQFNSYNNIIWRNDPDHIELSEKEAYRSCITTSLTGSLFMVTDKPEKYKLPGLIEAAKRSIPVLYTQPGQVYDVDPSASNKIAQVDIELSGSGPRPFDAGTSTTTGLFALEINKPFENWMVLGRLDERDKILSLSELGMDSQKEYLIFEFWTKQFLGSFQKQFLPPAIDTIYKCQVFCFRENKNHPQLLATNRHISCGGLELINIQWENHMLSGSSELVAGDDYILYIYEPGNFTFSDISIKGAHIISNDISGQVRKITISANGKENAEWSVQYK